MSRRSHRRQKEAPELDITAFLNLMVVLVPFLLVSAVFSRVTILELNLPTAAGANQPSKILLSVEVIIREKGLEIGNGRQVIARYPKTEEGEYDLVSLQKYLLKIKGTYPDKTDAMVLMEPDIEYDYLINVMDAIRSAEIRQTGGGTPKVAVSEAGTPGDSQDDTQSGKQKVVLFPDISIGDAP